MNPVPISIIIPTIGIPELFEMLASVATKNPLPDQVIVVVDDRGRSCSPLTGSLGDLEAQIQAHLPMAEVLHNAKEDWQMNNQTFNIGIEHARNRYVFVTHDDVVFPDDSEYFLKVGRTIERYGDVEDKRFVGSVFPAFHERENHTSPSYPYSPAACQSYSAVASLLDKEFWEEVGRFDEKIGIWWDVQMQGEILKHDVYMYYESLPPILHRVGRALTANKCGDGWTKAPLWSDSGTKYQNHYGEYIARGGKSYSI